MTTAREHSTKIRQSPGLAGQCLGQEHVGNRPLGTVRPRSAEPASSQRRAGLVLQRSVDLLN